MRKGLIVGICFLFILIVLMSVVSARSFDRQYISNEVSCADSGLYSLGILNDDLKSPTYIGTSSYATFKNGFNTNAGNYAGSSTPSMCIGSEVINLWTDQDATASTCSDSNICRHWGVLVGGYLYAGSNVIYSQGIMVGTRSSSNNGEASAWGSSIICSLWDDSKDEASYETLGIVNNFKALSGCISSTYNYATITDYAGETNNLCPFGNGVASCKEDFWSSVVALPAGVYTIAMGIRADTEYNYNDNAQHHLFPMANFPTQNPLYKEPSLKSTSPFYIISNRVLTTAEINTFPPAEIEANFCEAAGFDKHPVEDVCCGNDATDEDMVVGGYYCDFASKTWKPGVPTPCIDSDEGAAKNINIKGSCIDSAGQRVYDTCPTEGGVWIYEQTCESDACKELVLPCDEGYICESSTPNVGAGCVVAPICGDNTCDNDETCTTCLEDCGECETPTCESCRATPGNYWCVNDGGDDSCVTGYYSGGCTFAVTLSAIYRCPDTCATCLSEEYAWCEGSSKGDICVKDSDSCTTWIGGTSAADCEAIPTNCETCLADDVPWFWCNDGQTCVSSSDQCSSYYAIKTLPGCTLHPSNFNTCEDCAGEGLNWCTDSNKCVSSPFDEAGCDNWIDNNNVDFCPQECVAADFNNYDHEIPDEHKARFKEIMSYKCERTFSFNSRNTGYLLLENKQFEIENRSIIEILDITSNYPNDAALLTLTINKDEISFPNDAFFYMWDDSSNSWEELEYEIGDLTDATSYFYQIAPPHFSLFLIAEIDYNYCGNEVFNEDYEVCDGSVEGVINCTADCTACDSDFDATLTGFCIESGEGKGCSLVGNETCTGYTLYECDSDLTLEKKGKVIGECNVECSPIGNMSCQGEIPIRCGSDYDWDFQSKINGLCGYVSTTTLDYDGTTTDRCGNGYCNYDEDEYSCPEDCVEGDDGEEPNWGLIALVAGIAILILIIVIVLFKIFSKERRRGMPAPNRRLPPEHRPGPKRPLGRPIEHNRPVGRPGVGQGPYPRRRYPVR